jgi:hypothetical protein
MGLGISSSSMSSVMLLPSQSVKHSSDACAPCIIPLPRKLHLRHISRHDKYFVISRPIDTCSTIFLGSRTSGELEFEVADHKEMNFEMLDSCVYGRSEGNGEGM